MARARSGKSRRQFIIESIEPRVLLSKTIYVDVNATGATHDGTSWTNAFVDLQQGLAAAVSGDEIHVADGTYKPTSGTDPRISFALKSGVSLFGGYAGYAAPKPDTRDIALYATILSGDIGAIGEVLDNSYHVLIAIGTGTSTAVNGVTITQGNANGFGTGEQNGAGVFVASNSMLTLTDCIFSTNTASSEGGGIFTNTSSSLILANCSFTANAALFDGGGICSYAPSSLALKDCTFSRNSAQNGGALYNSNSLASLTNCTFFGNVAENYGGGMYNLDSSPNLTNCIFNGNKSSYGGAICNYLSSSPVGVNCIFIGNTASALGGAIYNYSASPKLVNCTLSANIAFSEGGGIYSSAASAATIINCIVWSSGSSAIVNNSSTLTALHSDIENGYGYGRDGNVCTNPQFIRSPWTGPDGVFGSVDDDYGNLRLRGGSICVDGGSNTAIPGGVTTDLAGNPRIQNGTVDLGAYEGGFAAPAAKVIYADVNGVGANTGISWNSAFTDLQSAILVASDGDTIRVADGIYKPTPGSDRAVSFALRAGVSVSGGYAGYGSAYPDARDVVAYSTIVSGDIGMVGVTDDNSYHVVTAVGLGAPAAIDGLTVSHGQATGFETQQSYGAGVFAACSSTLNLTNCILVENDATNAGGMYCLYSSPTLIHCALRENTAALGGGMSSLYSSPTLIGCTFSENTGGEGGGMYNFKGGALLLTNCAFIKNTALRHGGGAMYNNFASPVLTNCIFSGNAAASSAGMENYYSSPVLLNCTFVGNTAYFAGGLSNAYSSPTLVNCIIWNCGSIPIDNSNSAPAITYSDIEGGYSGTGNINVDPLFTNGSVDQRLRPNSPCIDAGDNSAVFIGITTDAAGNSRIVDYPGVHDPGAIVDMGAYERPASLTAAGGGFISDGAQPGVQFVVSSQIDQANIAAGDVLIRTVLGDGSLGATVNATGFSYDSTTRAIRFNLPVSIVDGNYRASLLIGSVSDTYGNALAAECSQDFFILGGDANRDRKVDINDLYILASNWQGSGKVFSQGDFNYDGKVDAADLGILSSHWQQALPPPAAAAPVLVKRAPTRAATRIVSLVVA